MADENDPGAKVEHYRGDDSKPPPLSHFMVLKDVEVELTLEIGRRQMKIADVLRLQPGQTVELNKAAGEPIDIYVNDRLLGRGEAVVVGDRYGVRITELVEPDKREGS